VISLRVTGLWIVDGISHGIDETCGVTDHFDHCFNA
jgi:hypothetical protein